MRTFVCALSLAAIVSSVSSATAAPSLWDGGLLPEYIQETTFDRAVTPRQAASDSAIYRVVAETFAPVSDEDALASIAASIELDFTARFLVLLDHEGESSFPSIAHLSSHIVSGDAEPEWGAVDPLPSPAVLAGLVVPGQRFLVEDEDVLPDVHYTDSTVSAHPPADREEAKVALDGYEDR
jgi:hypothetical protein